MTHESAARMGKTGWAARLVLPVVFWVGAAIAVPYLGAVHLRQPGWDVRVYQAAVRSVREGRDPYSDGVAEEKAFHAQWLRHPDMHVALPLIYIYPPITLPLLKAAGRLPARAATAVTAVYWLLYALGMTVMILAGGYTAEGREQWWFLLLAPTAIYFPGLINNNVFLSGNLSYILYGCVLGAAVWGWHKGRWGWFYAAVAATSCFKAPLLSLALIPALSERRQWVKASVAIGAGAVLFALQPALWPVAFPHFLEALGLLFSYNRDLGMSPAGLLGSTLLRWGVPYSPYTTLFFALYMPVVFGMLVYLSRRYLRGEFSRGQWLPVLLLGVALLNPRVKEYDLAAMSVPMALVAWRLCSYGSSRVVAMAKIATWFVAVNLIGYGGWKLQKATMCLVLVSLFAAGCWQLLHPRKEAAALENFQGLAMQ